MKLTFTLGGAYRLVAAYNRRIDRPGEPELRIFPKYDDPELLKVGNPYLRPQLTNVFELGLARSWNRGSASAAAYHRDITDAFKRIFAIEGSNPDYNIVNKIYENAGNSRQTGLQVILEQDIVGPWRVSANVNWFIVDIDAFETTLLFPTARPFSLAAPAMTPGTSRSTTTSSSPEPGSYDSATSTTPHATFLKEGSVRVLRSTWPHRGLSWTSVPRSSSTSPMCSTTSRCAPTSRAKGSRRSTRTSSRRRSLPWGCGYVSDSSLLVREHGTEASEASLALGALRDSIQAIRRRETVDAADLASILRSSAP